MTVKATTIDVTSSNIHSSCTLVDEIYAQQVETDPFPRTTTRASLPIPEACVVAVEEDATSGNVIQALRLMWTRNNSPGETEQPFVGWVATDSTPLTSFRSPVYGGGQGHVHPCPENCQIHRHENVTCIKIRWLDAMAFWIGVFTIVWDGFLIAVAPYVGWMMLVLPHTWVGLWLTYITACGFMNSSYITITNHYVEVEQRPVNLCARRKKIQFEEGGYREIRVRQKSAETKNGRAFYEVYMWDGIHRSSTVLPLRNAAEDVALFVAGEIRKHMNPSVAAEIKIV